jgi:hypothetical protein
MFTEYLSAADGEEDRIDFDMAIVGPAGNPPHQYDTVGHV